MADRPYRPWIFTAEQIASAKRQPSAIMEMLKEEHREVTGLMTPAERAVAFKNHNELMALAFEAGERLRRARLGRTEERDRFPDRPRSTIRPKPDDDEPDAPLGRTRRSLPPKANQRLAGSEAIAALRYYGLK